MRITDVRIDQFGAWQDLRLSLQSSGLTVVHGPNEAGKSTLLRFVRGMLYGFERTPDLAEEGPSGGSLGVRVRGENYELERRITPGQPTFFRCRNGSRPLSEMQFEELLQHVDAEVFQTIYTLGLKELRELGTLQAERVSEYIYGSSLGRVGQRLMRAEQRIRQFNEELVKSNAPGGKLFDLSGRYESTREALAKSDQVMTRYRDAVRETSELEAQLQSTQRKLEQLQREDRGLRFLQRVWTPWKRQQELQRELSQYADVARFPENGLRKLEALERKRAAGRKLRSAQLAELKKLRALLQRERQNIQLRDNASGLRALLQLRGLVETAERHHAAISADASLLKAELDDKLQGMGSEWTLQKLDAVDTSPEAHWQLVQSARDYRNALSRRARHRHKYKKVSDANHNRQTELQESLKKRNVTSVEQAIRQTQNRLKELEQLAQLRIQESEYEQRIRSASTLLQKYREGAELPWWASLMLTLFTMGGGFLIILGLLKSVQTSWLVGTIYVLTGVMGSALAWSLRQHYETDDHRVHSKLEAEIEECQQKLDSVRGQIARLTGVSYNARAVYRDPQSQQVRQNEGELIRQTMNKLVELEGMARTQERILKVRKKLSVQRGKLAVHQREVSRARQQWCDLLKKLGLRETLRTAEAFQTWQRAVDGSQTLVKWNAARDDMQRQAELLAMFREHMEQIAGSLQAGGLRSGSLSQALIDWQRLLDEYEQTRQLYRQHKLQYRELRQQAEQSRAENDDLTREWQELLRQGGADSAEQFRRNAQKLQRTGEVRALLADIDDQLNSLIREEPELAIVEEELSSFQVENAKERLEWLALEIAEVESQRGNHLQALGRIRQTLADMESDSTPADLRARQQRLLDEGRLVLLDWQAGRGTASTLTQMLRRFEQQFQPETLARASHYLSRLTCGRYEQVRTPFGTRDLIIHEANGRKRHIAELSDGTREQLFLAIRLALVEILANEGIQLPMVLDDICVNFDEERTEAAVATILEFSQQRQVLFFTCHRHLAAMFERRGVTPLRLPAQQSQDRMRADRPAPPVATPHTTRPTSAPIAELSQNLDDLDDLDDEDPFEEMYLDKLEKELREEQAEQETLRYYLHLDAPLVEAPSIGPKTAARFHKIQIFRVREFLTANPDSISERLQTRWITPVLVKNWQQQAELMCDVPALRCHDAQILQGVGVENVHDLAQATAEDLFSLVDEFVSTSEGQRILRNGKRPDLEEVSFWIANARRSHQTQAA